MSDDTMLDAADLAAQVDLLHEENRRLREQYARARQQRYRRTAAGLVAVGVVAAVGAIAFPDAREVLVALAAIGAFGAVLVRLVTPGAVLTADVGERVYAAMAANAAAMADVLGLEETARYLPTDAGIRLYVPHAAATVDPTGDGPFVTDADGRGLVLVPTGEALVDEINRATVGIAEDQPALAAQQLADGVVELLELARRIDVDVEETRVSFAVAGSAVGDVDRFDHPLASTLATGLAASLDRAVELEVTPSSDHRFDWLVTCRWTDREPEANDAR